jgi:lipopolysaccharide exporter
MLVLKGSSSFKNILVVMSGTAVAQVIGFALTPIVSRLFTPSDFGIFGSFTSVLSIIAAGVTLQYAQAIMLPKEDDDAANVFAVSMLSVILITALSVAAALFFSNPLLNLFKSPEATVLLWFLPLGVFLSGINQSFQAWCIRRKAFKLTSASQIVRAVVVNTAQIAFGFFKYGGPGLVAGAAVADGTTNLYLSGQVCRRDWPLLRRALSLSRIRRCAVEYRDFPIYSATQNMMSAFSSGLPVLLLAYFYGIGVAGSFAFGLRLLQVPMTFVLTSLRQVLFQKACETHNQNGNLFALFKKTTIGLFVIAVIPALILILIAPMLFVWIFGSNWHQAGIFVRWLVLWHLSAFCATPAGLFARTLRFQRKLFFFEILVLSSRFIVLVAGGFYMDVYNLIVLFSVTGVALDVGLILWIWKVLKYRHVEYQGKAD